MKRNHPAAVLFDMDGLLIDSERIALASVQHAATEIDQEIPAHVAHRLIGLGRDGGSAVLTRWLGEAFPVAAFWQSWLADYQARVAAGVPAKAGAKLALQTLNAAGVLCAVATSTETPLARFKLQKAELFDHFNVVVGRDLVAHGKPAPDLYLHAAKQLGVAAHECWAFEDSLPGLTAALASGARTHWVPDVAPIAAHELPEGVETVASLHELCGWL
jgi:HAD superfamily hydrolase (TIGR01509 family)